jgi:KUP system potassium uptake protein
VVTDDGHGTNVTDEGPARGSPAAPAVRSWIRDVTTDIHRPSTSPARLVLAALGVVFGDIGTSPLYALRECFHGPHGVAASPENVLGVLSLVFWALVVVISIKYLAFVMRADNNGEGGTLALMALIPSHYRGPRVRFALLGLGLFGTSLLYGDGMITPAITVLGAVEGLNIVTPFFTPYVVPLSLAILLVLFLLQSRGTAAVGAMFGPVMLVWFAVIAALGLASLARGPGVLAAVNPLHAASFFAANGHHSILVLGSVFLVVTGGEALYADMGHFGRQPIRRAWFFIAQPALMLNYFGQGALLLADPSAAESPFYRLAPAWALVPLVALATAAATIASQALISAVFSLTRGAVQLGYSPRMKIDYTSETAMGQVYIRSVNWALMAATMALVVGFRSSSRLASAYGIAVTMNMTITTVLAYVIARQVWRWSRLVTWAIIPVFLVIDLAFFAGNALKIVDGGWVPLVIALVIYTLLTTWKTGRTILYARLQERFYPLDRLFERLRQDPPLRVPGTAVFMTGTTHGAPPPLLHNLRHNKVLHRQIVLLTVATAEVPHVADGQCAKVTRIAPDFFRVTLDYGFMDQPDVPAALAALPADGELRIDSEDITYFLGRETLLATNRPGMAIWREKLFGRMSGNAQRATVFFRIPPEQVVEIGLQVEL